MSKKWFVLIFISLMVTIAYSQLMPALAKVRDASANVLSKSNLMTLAIASNYYKSEPPPFIWGNGYIGTSDFILMAEAWLNSDCDYASPCNNADVYPQGGDGKVNFLDFAFLANIFGDCYEPTDPTCTHIAWSNFAPASHAIVSGVQPYSGELILSETDINIPGRGLSFEWSRTYRSRHNMDSNNVQWHFSGDIYLSDYSGTLVLHDGTGRGDRFYLQANGKWAARGYFAEIEQLPNNDFLLTFFDTSTWLFTYNGTPLHAKISVKTDRNGNTLTYQYDPATEVLLSIVDGLSSPTNLRALTFGYNSDGFLQLVTDWLGRSTTYAYYNNGDADGSKGDLKSVTTPAVTGTPNGNDFQAGKTTTYTYSTGFADEKLNHNLLTITDPKGQVFYTATYDPTIDPSDFNYDRVISVVQDPANPPIQYSYGVETPASGNNYAVTNVTINDHVGNVTEQFYDHLNREVVSRQYTGRGNPMLPTRISTATNLPVNPLRSTDPSYFETKYQYNDDSLLTSTIYPNGNETVLAYDTSNLNVRSHGNLLTSTVIAGPLGGDQVQIQQINQYGATDFNFVTSHFDGRGNETLFTYDGNGNMLTTTNVRISDPNITHSYGYNAFGQQTSHTWPDNGSGVNRLDTYVYYVIADGPQYGALKTSTLGSGTINQTTTYEYDAVFNTTRIIDPAGNDETFIYNQRDQVVRAVGGDFTFNGNATATGSNVRTQTDTFYDENDNVVQVAVVDFNRDGDLNGVLPVISTTSQYDLLNNLTRIIDDIDVNNGAVTEYEYDGNNNVTLVRSPEAVNATQPNNTSSIIYDERDLVFQKVRALGDTSQSSTQFDYDGNGNGVTVSQGLEGVTPNVSQNTYDGYDRLIVTSDPMGNTTEFTYDQNSNVVTRMDKGELVDVLGAASNVRLTQVDSQYDALNRLLVTESHFFDQATQIDFGDGIRTTTFTYNDVSLLTSTTDDLLQQTTVTYDALHRIALRTDAKGNTTAYMYDLNSNLATCVTTDKSDLGLADEIFTTVFSYDGIDRRVLTLNNDSQSTRLYYDSRSNITHTTDARGSVVAYDYDGLDRLTTTTYDMDGDGADGDGGDIVTTIGYDDASRLTTRTDDNGNTTSYVYDPVDRLILTTHGDLTTTTYDYDSYHNMVEEIAATGTIKTYIYDRNNRATGVTYTAGAGVATTLSFTNYVYDGLDRLTSTTDDAATVTHTYDSHSNVIAATLNGETTTTTFNGVGNWGSVDYPGGRQTRFFFDDLNRIAKIEDGGNALILYDYIGTRVEQVNLLNGIQIDYDYDNLGRIIGKTHSDMSPGDIDEHVFAWDAIHNKVSRTDARSATDVTYTYQYDAVSRLTNTSVTDTGPTSPMRITDFTLDGVGNRTSVTGAPFFGSFAYFMDSFVPPADDQVNQYSAVPWLYGILYDDNGNMTTTIETNTQQPPIIDYSYDALDRLVSVSDSSTGDSVDFSYDPYGRRIAKIVTPFGSSPVETYFFYDGNRVIETQDNVGATIATYVYGLYIDEVLNMHRGSQNYYYHSDDMYNVMALSDSTGKVVERYEYDDYGAPITVTTTGIENPYLFNGRRYDAETGLYYFRARYLDPKAGRFISRDPIGTWGDGSNLGNGNTFVANNPWSNLDPYGDRKRPKFKAGADLSKKVNIAAGGGNSGDGSDHAWGGGSRHTVPMKNLGLLIIAPGGGSGTVYGNVMHEMGRSPSGIGNRQILKTYFETGDTPTEQNFSNFIDSFICSGSGGGDGSDHAWGGGYKSKPPSPGGYCSPVISRGIAPGGGNSGEGSDHGWGGGYKSKPPSPGGYCSPVISRGIAPGGGNSGDGSDHAWGGGYKSKPPSPGGYCSPIISRQTVPMKNLGLMSIAPGGGGGSGGGGVLRSTSGRDYSFVFTKSSNTQFMFGGFRGHGGKKDKGRR